MPAAAAAALASAAFTAAGGVAAGALAVAAATIAYGVGFAVVSLGISFAVGSIMGAVFKPRTANSFSSEAQGRSQVVRSNVQPRNLIYGRVMTSGPLVYATSTDGEGKKNLYMHLVIALADHECDAVEQVYLGEDSVGGIVDVGTYTFAGQLDLGSTEKSRLTAAIDTVSFDTADSVDERFDFIDSWLSVDGNLVNDTSVSLFVRTTNDDPAGAAVWTAWQRFSMGDYEARAFQWKVELTSASATHNVLVTGLSVTVDMPDRRESGRDVVSAVGATPITYGKAFRVSPVVGITAQNMAQGDYFVVNKGSGLPGFTITFFNASNVAISRRFDWDAVAY